MRELGLALVQATEAAALAAAAHLGRGDKIAADRAATEALRAALHRIDFAGRVVIGEGQKDQAPGLFHGEAVGARAGSPPTHDIAVDPIDGTTQTARGGTEAVTAVTVGPAGSLFATPVYYMRRVAVGPRLARRLGGLTDDWLHLPSERLITVLARAARKSVAEVGVCLLDRPRHEGLLHDLRRLGCKVYLCDCDVAGVLATAFPRTGLDVCLGVGGAPEAVLCAAALKSLGGALQAELVDPEGQPADGRLLRTDDLARCPVVFAATGITPGRLFHGVRLGRRHWHTHSLLLCSEDGSVRWCHTRHPRPVS